MALHRKSRRLPFGLLLLGGVFFSGRPTSGLKSKILRALAANNENRSLWHLDRSRRIPEGCALARQIDRRLVGIDRGCDPCVQPACCGFNINRCPEGRAKPRNYIGTARQQTHDQQHDRDCPDRKRIEPECLGRGRTCPHRLQRLRHAPFVQTPKRFCSRIIGTNGQRILDRRHGTMCLTG